MPLLARRAASATERTLVYFRMTMYMRPPMRLSPSPRIKAYRVAAGLGAASEMGPKSSLETSRQRSLLAALDRTLLTFVPPNAAGAVDPPSQSQAYKLPRYTFFTGPNPAAASRSNPALARKSTPGQPHPLQIVTARTRHDPCKSVTNRSNVAKPLPWP
jgi:hypothetical protein